VKRHARALRDHVDALARRGYQTAKGSTEFVVMFVAGEAFLSSACIYTRRAWYMSRKLLIHSQ